jgi:hypothetical protein
VRLTAAGVYDTEDGGIGMLSLSYSREKRAYSREKNVWGRRMFRYFHPITATALGTIYLAVFACSAVASSTVQVVHSFCQKDSCSDGQGPWRTPLRDATGNLFGATRFGGVHGRGTVYELIDKEGVYKFKTLYRFCATPPCADGATPRGPLIQDLNGALYGVAELGGANNAGVVYRLKPNKRRTKWDYKVLYSFCSMANCADGSGPSGALTYLGAQTGAPYDGVSPLYGTTGTGGNSPGWGVAFRLTRGAKHTIEKAIYLFCSVGSCDDGSGPMGTLLPDADGNLYGVLNGGSGGNANGAIFELSQHGSVYDETLLYNFCALAVCADGSSPREALSFDSSGNIIGATWRGGTHDSNDSGVVFKLIPNGSSSQLSVLYDFCAKAAQTENGLTMV